MNSGQAGEIFLNFLVPKYKTESEGDRQQDQEIKTERQRQKGGDSRINDLRKKSHLHRVGKNINQ